MGAQKTQTGFDNDYSGGGGKSEKSISPAPYPKFLSIPPVGRL